jgi:aryl-phospho-beta-D-glucosidase BglC (GH1 family)
LRQGGQPGIQRFTHPLSVQLVNTQMLNSWYTDGYPSSDFEAGWQWLAQHYVHDDAVIAVDLFNEPHGQPGDAGMAK